MINFRKTKKAQEEMVGFILIVVIVMVILVIFLGFSLKNTEKEVVESFEVDNFILSFTQYTTDCRDSGNSEFLSLEKVISQCDSNKMCLDRRDSCDVLENTLEGIAEGGWGIGAGSPIKGYELNITSSGGDILFLKEGNVTSSSRGNIHPLPRGIDIYFTAYY